MPRDPVRWTCKHAVSSSRGSHALVLIIVCIAVRTLTVAPLQNGQAGKVLEDVLRLRSHCCNMLKSAAIQIKALGAQCPLHCLRLALAFFTWATF